MALHGGRLKDIARMDRVVEIYDRVATDTDYSFTESDVLVSTEWAEELPQTRTMREEIFAGKEGSMQEVRFRVRKSSPVTTKHWIKYDGQLYDIITVLNEGRDFLVLVTQLRPDHQWQ